MSSVRTRRQAQNAPGEDAVVGGKMNGHAPEERSEVPNDLETEENVFLFWPNIIGIAHFISTMLFG